MGVYLSARQEERLRARLEALPAAVTMTLTVAPVRRPADAAAVELVQYLVALAPRRLRMVLRAEGAHPTPRLEAAGPAGPCRVTFRGSPTGFQLDEWIRALELSAGAPPPRLDPVTAGLLEALPRPVPARVYVSPT
ncbi:MAG: hypothetical protein OWV35_00645 [Firmicutes bacterium]|nr:hypothetical protein [Bacillota bacterium]